MKFASLIIAIWAVILPVVPTTKLPAKSAHRCPNPPGHERMEPSPNGGVRLICLHHSHRTEK